MDVLVDGAHGPGMMPVRLREIGAGLLRGQRPQVDVRAEGRAFLHVRRDRQALIKPLAISHGANDTRMDRSSFRLEFDWKGTLDPTPG